MSKLTSQPANSQPGNSRPAEKEKKPLIPPDEKFWQRYSPHHEAPLSGVSSFFLHVSVLALFGLIFWIGSKMADSNKSIPVDAVALGSAGGGGDPGGADDAAGKVAPKENVDDSQPNTPRPNVPTPAPQETLQEVKADPLD